MGVTGLWSVLQPCARPIKLETLNRARLAVDASIWIYQFLKAVRDKEGNALRNSHVVGFFRRICKLLFFGIKPVFVFDGGAPALKRQTVLGRQRRREGRRDDAVRTAGKLLAVQMQRRAEVDEEKRVRQREVRGGVAPEEEEEDVVVDESGLVYVDEIGMSKQERQQTRKFTKRDAYHLPELQGGIENMGQPNDPRIMSSEELEEYARQFNSGEDINLYDFSKIDFNGEFFTSLPAVDRYNILNAARLRSRLRMGLSKEQLEEMFPDRMAFSRFQIERVRERNELTQRLMNLNGMNGEEAMFGANGGGRIAGEKGREYVLVKNDGVEGGWALGVVSTEKNVGERSKPIDVDALPQHFKREEIRNVSDEEDDFEDVPVEGLNRLPKLKRSAQSMDDGLTDEMADKRRRFYDLRKNQGLTDEDAQEEEGLFVAAADNEMTLPSKQTAPIDDLFEDEAADLNRAIAMSLRQNHDASSEDEGTGFEDVPMPQYEQRVAEQPKPLTKSSGRMVAHVVNNRANAAVPKRRRSNASSDDDEDMDLQAVLAASRKAKPDQAFRPAPVAPNTKNPFDGPLPFEKLDFKGSLFGKKKSSQAVPASQSDAQEEDEPDLEGGFQRDGKEDAAKPLPPWLVKNDDIRSDYEAQRTRDAELNAEDRERAEEDARIFRRDHGVIEVASSDEEGSDVEEIEEPQSIRNKKVQHPIDLTRGETQMSVPAEIPHSPFRDGETARELAEDVRAVPPVSDHPNNRQPTPEVPESTAVIIQEISRDSTREESVEWSESDPDEPNKTIKSINNTTSEPDMTNTSTPSPADEDHEIDFAAVSAEDPTVSGETRSLSPVFEDVNMPDPTAAFPAPIPILRPEESDAFDKQQVDNMSDVDFDEFSDPDDEELLAQLATEAEEHARFASTLNNKSEKENQDQYERELKALRNQQKKDRRDADEVSHIMIQECQALLRLFGLPYITAPMEAEAQCAELVHLGLVDGIVTDDSDVFLFGGTRVYKNMFNSNKFVECYLANDLEKELSLARPQLVSIAQLLGSDYTEGLPGIGPVTALELISEFPNADKGLQEFKDWWSDVQARPTEASKQPGSSFRKKFRRAQAKKLFLPPGFPSPAVTNAYLNPEVDHDPEQFQWGVPDLQALREFLMATIGWSADRTDEVLVPVIKDMNRRETEGTQSNITRFFSGGVGVGARGEDKEGRLDKGGSIRMKEAVRKLKVKKQLGEPGRLEGTFGDEAAEWARKNELSETARVARLEEKEKEKARKDKGKNGQAAKKKRITKTVKTTRTATTNVEDAGDVGQSSGESDDEYVQSDTARKRRRNAALT